LLKIAQFFLSAESDFFDQKCFSGQKNDFAQKKIMEILLAKNLLNSSPSPHVQLAHARRFFLFAPHGAAKDSLSGFCLSLSVSSVDASIVFLSPIVWAVPRSY